jgi:hypothetical protein
MVFAADHGLPTKHHPHQTFVRILRTCSVFRLPVHVHKLRNDNKCDRGCSIWLRKFIKGKGAKGVYDL